MQDHSSSPERWRPGEAATRLGASYKANREVLEPILLRLPDDALALAALLRHQPASPPRTAESVKLP